MFCSRVVGFVIPFFLFFSLHAGAAVVLPAPTPEPSVLSFKEWKNDRSSVLRARYLKLQTDYILKKSENPKDSSLKAMYRELKNTKSNVDEIGDLTVSDYFVGYLSRFKNNSQVFKQAAQKLDSTEVAELMTAYADSLLKTSGEGLSTSQQRSDSEASK